MVIFGHGRLILGERSFTYKGFLSKKGLGRGATAVAAYSTRARSGAPVSTPVSWEEVAAGIRPDQFNVRNLAARLSRLRKDPWENYESSRRPITAAMMKELTRR
jgi:bifunctional non-homologous end joining protein LigD